ncbi:UPF0029-domain-containing protein [Violaceomyces palustris]|uniref:UPF0029-domain-containing protein n=1 Tax=Violaceomyces palustris TaxID=1673888 RepID=A0ACD0P590_9BASI|nr:UPF0029-domain-containing protein [Violaceomyces palustris]
MCSPVSQLISRLEEYSSTSSSSSSSPQDHHDLHLQDQHIHNATSSHLTHLDRTEAARSLAEELLALTSIYSEENVEILRVDGEPAVSTSSTTTPPWLERWSPSSKVTLSVKLDLQPQLSPEKVPLRVALTLPPHYPRSGSRPPQLQLLSTYLSGFKVDHSLFGNVLRAFLHLESPSRQDQDPLAEEREEEEQERTFDDSVEEGVDPRRGRRFVEKSQTQGLIWKQGEPILFESVEWVKELVEDWWDRKESLRISNSNDRGLASSSVPAAPPDKDLDLDKGEGAGKRIRKEEEVGRDRFVGEEQEIFSSEPILERKSVFVGHAARILHPSQVQNVLNRILSDKKVARAAHPIINAWVCTTEDGVVHRDCDDDGESAAGGRLAHLLSILELNNVIVVVTRWFGGIHLGPDRFKLINRAARDALEVSGFLKG